MGSLLRSMRIRKSSIAEQAARTRKRWPRCWRTHSACSRLDWLVESFPRWWRNQRAVSSAWLRDRTALCLLAVTGVFGAASAVGASSEAAQSESVELAPITVSAEKRDERIQYVPMSITAIPASVTVEHGASTIRDLLLAVPGLSYSAEQLGLARYSIRGVSTAAASPTVGLYLDDVSLVTVGTAFSGAADPQLFDLDRIEVLEGPQGTMYGGSAMGGAIKYVTRKPALDAYAVSAAGEAA